MNDAELIAQAAGGSDVAFRQLYRAYARPVYWIAHALLRDVGDAEDVMQETFVVAWRKLPGFTLAGESALPWLSTICRFHAANRMRLRRREREHRSSVHDGELHDVADTVDVEQQVIDRALADRILDELGKLSDLDRRIFVLCATEGYAYQAAAERLGVDHGTVRNRLSRIRTRLRTAVKETP